jgi:putative MATE family efflux protein
MASHSLSTGARRANLIAWNTPRELVMVIILLALPVMVSNALQMTLGFVDTRMCSPLGAEALSAMAIGRQATMLLMALFMGLGVGITAYVARLMGAGQQEKARVYATLGVISAGVIGLILLILGWLFAKPAIQMMVTGQGDGANPASIALARKYAWDLMSIMFISLVGLGVQVATVNVFNSLGRTVYPMFLLMLANVANLAGNILLIPHYQVAGSAASTAIMNGVTACVAIYTLSRHKALDWNWRSFVEPLTKAWEMLKVGLPVTAQLLLRGLSMLTVLKLITLLPDHVAGQGAMLVGLQAESIAFMPAFAFSTAAATLVGQNLGARRPGQARLSALYCMVGSQVIMWGMGTFLFLYPKWFVMLFIGHNAPEVLEPAAAFLSVLALCLPGLGLGMTTMGVLRGSGDTMITALISFIAMYLVRLPLAAFLAMENIGGTGIGLGWGLQGIWWAMTFSVYVEAILAYIRFASGKWERVKLAGTETAVSVAAEMVTEQEAV